MAEPDRTKSAADWASRGFRRELWTDPPGQRWKDFCHATDEWATVLEGEMGFEVAGEAEPKPGENLMILVGWPGLLRAGRNPWQG